ncbi:MAG: FecR domain-containing protein, partial [Candidatus Omnitrophota bacterium]
SPLTHAFTVSGNFSVPYGASFARYTGTGTANDPYLIQTVYDLQAMKNNLNSHFKLDASLDAASVASWNNNTGFDPIGDSLHAFTGSLNGNGKVISNLKVDRADADYLGLFGNVGSTGSVSTLGLENISIYGHEFVGGLVGSNAGSLSNVYTTGVHTVSGVSFVGGLVGGNTGNIVNAYSSARTLGADKVGGLVGANTGSGTINKTYAMGYVTGTSNAGGLVGANTSIAANSVSDSFWNVGSTGRSARGGVTEGTGVASVEGVNAMMNRGTYSGWDFATTWVMDNSGTYPHFQFRYPEGVRGVGGVVYINSTVNDVTTQSKAGAGNPVSVYSAATEVDGGTYLDSTATGADSSYYVVLGKNAVGNTNYVVGVSSVPSFSDGSTRKLAGSGSVYPLNIWASENHTIAVPVMPDVPPIVKAVEEGNNAVNSALIIPPTMVTPPTVTTIPTVTIVDQTGAGNTTQNFNDFSNLIGGVPSAPVTEPLVVVPQTVTPPVAEEQKAVTQSETPQYSEDTSDEMDISFEEEPSAGREPVPLKADEKSSTESTETKSSDESGSVSKESTSEKSEGSVEKGSAAEESESSGEKDGATPTKDDGKAADWRDVPITGFTGNEDAKKFLTDVRVIEGAVYVIDGGNAMSLLGMGDSMRVFFKRKKTTDRRPQTADGGQQTTAKAEALKSQISDLKSSVSAEPAMKQALDKMLQKVAAEPEVTPAPEARVLKSATPIVMRQSEDGTRYGTLKNPGKDVFVRSRGGEWKSAKDGMVILSGDEVKTAEKNSVDVLMDGGKVGRVEIKEGSLFRIQQASTDAATGDKTTILDLAIGKILVKVEALKGNGKFEVRTPTALTGVRGTIFEVTVREKA